MTGLIGLLVNRSIDFVSCINTNDYSLFTND